ncbi:hypothetical protein V6Z12_A08G124400 [Gossypium hirsutum]
MRITSPSPVHRGIFTTFLAGSRQVSGKVLKSTKEESCSSFCLKGKL